VTPRTEIDDPIRILIADDQSRARRGLVALLSTCPDFEVVAVAVDGREAVEFAVTRDAELVLMDVRMPGMDGLQATRMLKQLNPGISVLVLTMYGHAVDAAHVAGADAFLAKSAAAEQLIRTIRDIAKTRRSPPPAAGCG